MARKSYRLDHEEDGANIAVSRLRTTSRLPVRIVSPSVRLQQPRSVPIETHGAPSAVLESPKRAVKNGGAQQSLKRRVSIRLVNEPEPESTEVEGPVPVIPSQFRQSFSPRQSKMPPKVVNFSRRRESSPEVTADEAAQTSEEEHLPPKPDMDAIPWAWATQEPAPVEAPSSISSSDYGDRSSVATTGSKDSVSSLTGELNAIGVMITSSGFIAASTTIVPRKGPTAMSPRRRSSSPEAVSRMNSSSKSTLRGPKSTPSTPRGRRSSSPEALSYVQSSPRSAPRSHASMSSSLSSRSSSSPEAISSMQSSPTFAPRRQVSMSSTPPSSAASSPEAVSYVLPILKPALKPVLPDLPLSYSQQLEFHDLAVDNTQLREAVGNKVSLADPRKTMEIYRVYAKRTNSVAMQYEFAVFLVNASRDSAFAASPGSKTSTPTKAKDVDATQMVAEAKSILQSLAAMDLAYAQYYLADGLFSGIFNNGTPNQKGAFALFVSAGEHGHAEAAYRAALCHQHAWGCPMDLAKAVRFYRQAASRDHPGAATQMASACLHGEMGLGVRYTEGVTWLKRATESADEYFNQAPYELGVLHIHGYGDDILQDEEYAAQLLTMAGDLGHPEANFRMGESYEYGLLGCPKDPTLSIHFYNAAAELGVAKAMLALCAWYLVGAEPVLPRNEAESYEWAKKAADLGLPKAEYTLGFFFEIGVGCRRDMLKAKRWYTMAALHGEARATQRLAIIQPEIEELVIPVDSAPSQTKRRPSKLVKRRMSFGLRRMSKDNV